jgi:ubiquinone/menaquinone biosynthesis C-methylase UbiE
MTSTGPGPDHGRGEPLKDESRPMHEWRPLERFSSRAADYAKFRPGYPAEALAAVLDGLGDPSGLVAADVGAGTGISSRWLANAGLLVYAVEPNASMREAGASMPHERIEWVSGTGEATGLREACVDLVVCAQAFHWFKPDRALVEFVRILKPGGRLALVWNDRVDRDETTREYNAILSSFGADVRYEQSKKASEELRDSSLFEGYRERIVSNHQDMDLETAIGRTRSISTCPNEGPVWETIRGRLEQWFACRQRDGKVRLEYDCQVYTGRVRV